MGWIAAVVGAVGSFAGSMEQKEAQKDAQRNATAMTAKEALEARKNSQFEAEQAYYYEQLGRQNKQRGLDLFRERSTITQWDPNHTDNSPRIILPEKPVFNQGIYENTEKEKEEEPFSWKKKLIQPFYRLGQFGD